MDDSKVPQEVTLWQVVRRSWWVLALATLVAGAGAYAVASRLPKTYQSTVTLLVGPINSDTGLQASGTLTATYESLATSQPVLANAISVTHAPTTPLKLANNVTTTSNTISRLVTVSVSNRNPAMAATLANAIAARLTRLSQTSSQGMNAWMAAFDQAPQLASLTQVQRNIAEAALKSVLEVSPSGRVTVINPAIPPASAASPKKSLIAALGAVAGLLISAILLLALANRTRGAADEGSRTELIGAELGTVEAPPRGGHAYFGGVEIPPPGPDDPVSVEAKPNSVSATEYRNLARRLTRTESLGQSLLIVDSTDGSAAAAVAANLSTAMSRGLGRSVVLADVSTEPNGVTALLGLQGHGGLAELIAARDLDAVNGKLGELLVDWSEDVYVLPRGSEDHGRAVPARRARAVLRRLEEKAELVIIAGPPISPSAIAPSWTRAAGSVLFVIDGNQSSQDKVTQVTRDLALANTHFLGTVTGRRTGTLPVFGRTASIRG